MSAQNIIELGFNLEELTAEKKQVLDLLVDMFGKLKEYDGTKFNPLGSGGLVDLKKSLADGAAAMSDFQAKAANYNQVITEQFQKQQQNKKATDEVTLAVNQYKKILDDTATTQAKSNALGSTAAENLAIEREQMKQRTAELQKSAKYLIAESNSVEEARAQNALLTAEKDKQNTATEAGKAKIIELNAAIDKNNQFIKENANKLEQQKINIGNYTGAAQILKDSLQSIDARLQAMAEAGDTASEAFQKLTLEQKLSQQFYEKQAAGFSTVTAELRATKNALDSLTIAGLENTQTFSNLNVVYETAKQKVTELHDKQKILTSESPGLTAMAAAARGIGGAYALGAGASALFAEGNEKVEKELNKLVAIMTVLQGLEEAVKAVKERGAIATALQNTATKVLNASKQIEVSLFGASLATTEAETEAKTLNTAVTEGNTEALEGNAAGAILTETAMEGVAVSTGVATAATVGFRTALIATGIGAIIIGIIYGVTKLVGALGDWINADAKAAEKEKDLAESSKELLQTINQLNDAWEEGSKKILTALENQDAATKASGKNQFIQLDNERKILEERQKNAKEESAFLDLQGGALDALAERRIDALLKVEGVESKIRDARNEDDTSKVKDLTKDELAPAKAQFDALDAEYQKGLSAQKEYNDSTAKLDQNALTQKKASADQLAKITADAAERRFTIEKDLNDRILSLDSSTAPQKFTALKANYAAEVALEESKAKAIDKLRDADVITHEDHDNQIAGLQTDLNLKYKKYLEDRDKLRIEYNDRELTARNAISKNGNESDAAIQDAITKDTQQELDARLTALRQSIADKTQVIVDDYNLQLKLAKEHGKTSAEIDQLDSERQKALLELTATTQKEIYDIVISYGEKKLKAIEDLNKSQNEGNDVSDDYNAQVDLLNKSLLSQTISYTKFVKNKRDLDREYTKEKDAADVADDEAALARIRNFEDVELASKRRIADAQLAIAKTSGNEEEIKNAQAAVDAISEIQRKAAVDETVARDKLVKDKKKQDDDSVKDPLAAAQFLHDKEKQLAESSFTLAQTLVDASYQNKINHIQDEITKTDEQAAEEISAVQRSTLSQRDQAAELIIIQANQKARDTQLKNQQKQEKIKEAKFDRDVAAAKAFWATEQAVIEAIATYGGTPYAFAIAAVIAALGAVQIAEILAKPIPSYGEGIGIPGKGDHEGGLAWIGERNKPERVTMPGKSPFVVDKPTLMDLPAKTSVLPLDHSEMIYELGSIGIEKGGGFVNMISVDMTGVEDAINKQTYQLQKAFLKGQRKIRSTIYLNQAYGGLDPVYVMTKIIGRKS